MAAAGKLLPATTIWRRYWNDAAAGPVTYCPASSGNPCVHKEGVKSETDPVIAALRARCPRFENRVGAAQFKAIPDAGKLKLPAAYVVPSEDVTGEQKSQTDYWQDLTEGFSVIVVLSNERDEKGQWASYDAVHDVRHEIWKAVLGWTPDPDAHEITYAGGMLLELNRYELYYQFDLR